VPLSLRSTPTPPAGQSRGHSRPSRGWYRWMRQATFGVRQGPARREGHPGLRWVTPSSIRGRPTVGGGNLNPNVLVTDVRAVDRAWSCATCGGPCLVLRAGGGPCLVLRAGGTPLRCCRTGFVWSAVPLLPSIVRVAVRRPPAAVDCPGCGSSSACCRRLSGLRYVARIVPLTRTPASAGAPYRSTLVRPSIRGTGEVCPDSLAPRLAGDPRCPVARLPLPIWGGEPIRMGVHTPNFVVPTPDLRGSPHKSTRVRPRDPPRPGYSRHRRPPHRFEPREGRPNRG